MEAYLSKKYSSLLDIEDVESLFEKLKETYGSIGKTAAVCGVARSTAYGWEKANYLKSITRTKILKTSLEKNLIETLAFLTDKSKERTSDLLHIYLSSIYQEAIRKDRGDFQNLLNRILAARREHFGLIQDSLQDEVSKMMSVLTKRAAGFQISLPQDSLDMLTSNHLLEVMPYLMRDIFVEGADLSQIASRYNVPLEVPMTLDSIWKTVFPKLGTTFAQPTAISRSGWVDTHKLPYLRLFKGSSKWFPVEPNAADTAREDPARLYRS